MSFLLLYFGLIGPSEDSNLHMKANGSPFLRSLVYLAASVRVDD